MVMAEAQESMLPCARPLGLGLELVPSYFHGILLIKVSGQVWESIANALGKGEDTRRVKNWAIGASATVSQMLKHRLRQEVTS